MEYMEEGQTKNNTSFCGEGSWKGGQLLIASAWVHNMPQKNGCCVGLQQEEHKQVQRVSWAWISFQSWRPAAFLLRGHVCFVLGCSALKDSFLDTSSMTSALKPSYRGIPLHSCWHLHTLDFLVHWRGKIKFRLFLRHAKNEQTPTWINMCTSLYFMSWTCFLLWLPDPDEIRSRTNNIQLNRLNQGEGSMMV